MSKKRTLPAWMVKGRETESQEKHSRQDLNQQHMTSQCTKQDPATKITNSNVHDETMPYLKFPGNINYIYMKDECNFVCQDIIESSSKPLICGFDIEWKAFCKAGEGPGDTAVFQICASEDKCYVFQTSAMHGFPVALKSLIEDATIIKTGVGIKGDMSKLWLEYKLNASGVVDLSVLFNDMKGIEENWSLNRLLVHLLKKQLNKDQNIRCSNWERFPLSKEQLEYAATDAYAGWLLYHEIENYSKKTTDSNDTARSKKQYFLAHKAVI